ncbi:hypothetical protein RIR_jg11698.t1 [Rhizophagus irregularis DAOM 181602=DAOM 197198]|nr:hypothetical protein RIR_jg11698.t1 [Rhizophagus irregularis DAOM 181602=DAOM 197198]
MCQKKKKFSKVLLTKLFYSTSGLQPKLAIYSTSCQCRSPSVVYNQEFNFNLYPDFSPPKFISPKHILPKPFRRRDISSNIYFIE